MRIIQVPADEIMTVEQGTGKQLGAVNYFWFMLRFIIGNRVQRMSAIENHDIRPLYDEVRPQMEAKARKLTITKEADYTTLLTWVKEHRGWEGIDPVPIDNMFDAFRNATEEKKK